MMKKKHKKEKKGKSRPGEERKKRRGIVTLTLIRRLAGLGSSLPSFGRAGGLPSPAATWAWHPVLLSPHLASTSSTRASEIRAEVTVGLCPQFHGGTWRRRSTRSRRANPVAPRAEQPAVAAELAAAAGKARGQGSTADGASSFHRASHGGGSRRPTSLFDSRYAYPRAELAPSSYRHRRSSR